MQSSTSFTVASTGTDGKPSHVSSPWMCCHLSSLTLIYVLLRFHSVGEPIFWSHCTDFHTAWKSIQSFANPPRFQAVTSPVFDAKECTFISCCGITCFAGSSPSRYRCLPQGRSAQALDRRSSRLGPPCRKVCNWKSTVKAQNSLASSHLVCHQTIDQLVSAVIRSLLPPPPQKMSSSSSLL